MQDVYNHIKELYRLLEKQDRRLRQMNSKEFMLRFFKKNMSIQQETIYRGVHLALCVDTRDPLKQNRVKFFSPILHIPLKYSQAGDPTPPNFAGPSQVTKIEQLDWAWPISAMGGFDDAGLNWVPPAGSMLCLFFLNGDPGMAFYAGTTWYRNKGPIQHDNWNYHIPEYYKTWESHRAGYMVGPNDESQVFPHDNTNNYQGYDIDASTEMESNPDASTKTTLPHQYSISSPEKHRIILDDGDPKCNRRYKKLEIISSMGGQILIKDDPYHHCGSWLNPKCFEDYTDVVPEICAVSMTMYLDPEANTIEFVPVIPGPCPQGPDYCSTIPETPSTTFEQEYLGTEGLCPPKTPFPDIIEPNIPLDCLNGVINGLTDVCFKFNNMGMNKYQKHRHDCFPYYKQDCGLPQTGIQIRARSGGMMVFDDSVEEPKGETGWEATQKDFDMDGCTGNFRGRVYIKSATGHYIELVDYEDQPKLRGARNGINLVTACGNSVCLNDQTLPGGIAGPLRGVKVTSSSGASLEMCDKGNKQSSDERVGCAVPGSYANEAFVRLRSGYGIAITMCDYYDQTKTSQQYFQIMSPQKDNLTRGPHMLHMQEKADGAGQIFLRAGGDYITYTYDKMVEVVGEETDNPSDKMEFISRHKLVSVKNLYYNKAGRHLLWADDYIILAAGKDCDVNGNPNPCVYPVCIATKPIPEYVSAVTGIKASEHVFASGLQEPLDACEGIASDS